MRGAVMHGPGEVRVQEREAPRIVEPTDAIIRVSAACVCGSDLWPYRGIGVEDSMWPMPMGHEYAGIVEAVGDGATTVKPGQFVVGSFWATDNTCELCRSGYQSACVNRVPMGASTSPTPTPTAASSRPCPTISLNTRPRSAPSAMRTPISAVRCDTTYDNTP